MKMLISYMILLMLYSLAFSSDKIPVPRESADYSERYVFRDPESGDNIICNQIVIVFSEDVTSAEQKNILNKIGGKIIGGIPDMDMYQVGIENKDLNLKKVERVCQELKKNKKVIHASARKLPSGEIKKIQLGNAKPVRRTGQLDLEPAERAAPPEEDEMVTVLEAHKTTLFECLNKSDLKHGSIEYRITVNKAGQVTKTKILKSSFRDKILKDCLAHKIRGWEGFPEYEKDYDRQLEFTFKF
jgi:hypothetical protein